MIDEIELMADAGRLVEVLHDRGHEVVLASSASQEDLTFYLRKLGVADLIAGATSSDDVQKTKPAPDLILAALEKVSGQKGAVMVGDSTWDCEAARRVDIPSIALLTGGFGEDELRSAGASAVFESLGALIEGIDDTPLG
jgi:phosphoglycolate phosphatase-like HAD superfamily hydrolase